MIQTMKSFKRISFEDCDPFSHLNNANFLTYFLNAREQQLRENKVLNILEHTLKTGKSWVVTAHDIRYLRPAALGEKVEIWSRMLTCEASLNLVEFVMLDPESRVLKSVMHSRFAYFSVTRKRPVAPEKQIRKLFEDISLFPGRKAADFDIDSRLERIRTEAAGG